MNEQSTAVPSDSSLSLSNSSLSSLPSSIFSFTSYQALENVIESKEAVIEQIESMVVDLMENLMHDRPLVLPIGCRKKSGNASRSSQDNVVTDGKFPAFPGKTGRSAWKFGLIVLIDCGLVYLRNSCRSFYLEHYPQGFGRGNRGHEEVSCHSQAEGCVLRSVTRDIYYQDPVLFMSQNIVDRIVDDIAFHFGVSRKSLNVVRMKSSLRLRNESEPLDCRIERSYNWHVHNAED